jgi:tRNA threonylcarbamoyladenosine biosynthesis protein TsaE
LSGCTRQGERDSARDHNAIGGGDDRLRADTDRAACSAEAGAAARRSGAGKTTLVKGIAAAFEAAEEEDVTSPTFTLIHEYRGPRANLYHIDLYRIDTQRELETLALDDLRAENSILLIEWGEKFARFVRERDVEIALEREGENERRIRISGQGRVTPLGRL